MRPGSRFVALIVLSVLAFFTPQAFSQATVSFAQLNGTVADEAGRAIVGANISLRSEDTNQTYATTANDSGSFVFPALPPGHYDLTTTYTAFAKFTQTGIVLTVGESATVNVTLKVASAGETVLVTTEAPTVEATRTEISQVIDTKQISSLPVSGRLFTDFALMTPGVATGRTSLGTTFTEFEITQISFGGMRSFSNEITVDGADFINSNTGVQRATPPQDSVAEFRVVNSGFGSEYGRAVGGIVNVVTKSGTNDLHGSVYDYFQNSATDARSILQPKPAPFGLRQNQFGATLGGPIVKDKTFFFANYEGVRRSEDPILPPDFRNNVAEINLAKAYIGIPGENPRPQKTRANDYGFVRLDHQITNNNRLGVFYNVEDARDLNELVGNTEDGGGIGLPSGGRNLFIRDQSVVGTLNSLLKPDLVNTALVQYARRHYNFPGATGQPNLDIPNDLSFGHNFGTLDAIYESRFQASDSVSWVKGNHVAKFGFDSNYIWDATWYPGFTPARIILPDLNCLADFANYMDKQGLAATNPVNFANSAPCPLPTGPPAFPPGLGFHGVGATFYGVAEPRTGYLEGQVPLDNQFPLNTTTWANAFPQQLYSNYNYDLNHGYYGFFAQDQWRLTHKLTLNYGLRYDFETGLTAQIRSYYGAVQPRVGLAYTPDNKTVIRAGFGMFDDRNNMTFFFIDGNDKTVAPSANGPGYLPGITLPLIRQGADSAGYILNLVSNAQFLPGGVTCTGGIQTPGPCLGAAAAVAQSILTKGTYPVENVEGPCPPSCIGGTGGLDHTHSKVPYAEQASLEIDRQIGNSTTIDLGYLMVEAHRLVIGNSLNLACPVGTSKPDPNANGWLNANGTISNCSGTPQLLAGKPYFPGDGEEFQNGGFMDYNFSDVNAIYHGLTAQFIERLGHYFNLNANYTFSHTIDGGNFTTFINLPQNEFDQKSERANSNQDARHRFIADFTADAPHHGLAKNFEFSSVITLQSGRPFTMFTGGDSNGDGNPVTDRVGLTGRNAYTGPPLYSWDLRLSRFFQITERMRLDLMLDAFDVFNRQNVDEVFSVYGSPVLCGAQPAHFGDAASLKAQAGQAVCPSTASLVASGQIPTPPLNVEIPPQFGVPPTANTNFGTPRTMLNPRQLQFAIKFSF